MGYHQISFSRPVKKYLMMLLDGLLIPFSLWLALVLLNDRAIENSIEQLLGAFVLASIISVIVFYRMGLYQTILLYMGLDSALLILKGVTVSALALTFSVYIILPVELSGSTFPIFWMIALLIIGGVRFMAKIMQQNLKHNFRPKETVIIYGAGNSGMQLAAALSNGNQYLPVAFVDDSEDLIGNTVHGLKVYSQKSLSELLTIYPVRQILLAIPSATHAERKEILNRIEHLPVHVKTVPDLFEMVSGNVQVDEIRDVAIEDLLGRDAVPPVPQLMSACIVNQSVLITGAGGSIGSELCRQIINLKPSHIILYDNSEYGLYTIESELRDILSAMELKEKTVLSIRIVALLGSVRSRQPVENVFREYAVQTVYHAAAFKQVPMVEKNIVEAVHNNIFGTLVMAETAERYNVKNFVFISTDKAVRPANIMGATKRFAEQILQSFAVRGSKTKFSMVRFGNVLGSSGSVVPLFRKQIRNGGPVTVTHPEMTRYFMTVEEAAQLVIQAGSMESEGGDVFVLDMHDPVRIVDLARKMIHLMGCIVKDENTFNGDIAIEYTGLRPGEKLYEELLIGESVTGTVHPKIMRADENCLPWSELENLLARLEKYCANFDQKLIREVLAEAIGGFVNNEPESLISQKTNKEQKFDNVTLIQGKRANTNAIQH